MDSTWCNLPLLWLRSLPYTADQEEPLILKFRGESCNAQSLYLDWVLMHAKRILFFGLALNELHLCRYWCIFHHFNPLDLIFWSTSSKISWPVVVSFSSEQKKNWFSICPFLIIFKNAINWALLLISVYSSIWNAQNFVNSSFKWVKCSRSWIVNHGINSKFQRWQNYSLSISVRLLFLCLQLCNLVTSELSIVRYRTKTLQCFGLLFQVRVNFFKKIFWFISVFLMLCFWMSWKLTWDYRLIWECCGT